MPIYSVQGPDGRVYDVEGPPGASDTAVISALQRHLASAPAPQPPAPATPQPQPVPERSWSEVPSDIGASLVSGIGSLVKFPGELYGLATGNFNRTGALGVGQDLQDWAQEHKSANLRAKEANRDLAVQQAEDKGGQWGAFKSSIGQTVSDPTLLGNFLLEQLPNQLPAALAAFATPAASAGVGAARAAAQKAVGTAAEKAAAQAAKEAAVKAGSRAAVGTAAVQQGADVGAEAYTGIYDYLKKQGASDEEAAAEAINKARAAGASGAVISVLAQNLPGAKKFERILAGDRPVTGRIGAGIGTGLGEAAGEIAEEGGGQMAKNVAKMQVDPNQTLMDDVGKTAGMAAIGGGGMGLGAGVLAGRRETPQAPPPPSASAAPLPSADPNSPYGGVLAQYQKLMETGITPENADVARSLANMIKGMDKTATGGAYDLLTKQAEALKQQLATPGVDPAQAAQLQTRLDDTLAKLRAADMANLMANPEVQPPPAPEPTPAPPAETPAAQAPLALPAPPAPAKPAPPPGYADLVKERELINEREQLLGKPKTAQAEARVKEITAQLRAMDEERLRADPTYQATQEKAAAYAELQRIRKANAEAIKGNPELQAAREDARAAFKGKPEVPVAPPPSAPTAPTAPAVPGGLTLQQVADVAGPLRTTKKWFTDNVVGKTVDDVKALVQQQPALVEGDGIRAKALRALTAADVPAFKEELKPSPLPAPKPATAPTPTPATMTAPTAPVTPAPAPTEAPTNAAKTAQPDTASNAGATGPSVGVPGQAAGTVATPAGPATGTTRAAGPAEGSKRQRLVPDQRNAGERAPAQQRVEETLTEDEQRQKEADEMAAAMKAVPPKQKRTVEESNIKREADKAKLETPAEKPEPQTLATVNAIKRINKAWDDGVIEGHELDVLKKMVAEGLAPEAMTMMRKYVTSNAGEREASKYSKPSEAAPSGRTVEDVHKELTRGPMGAAVRRLIKSGKLKVEAGTGEGKVRGEFDGKTATLYADAVPHGEAHSVLMHEVGAHMGMKDMLGPENYQKVLDYLRDSSDKIAQRARNRIPEGTAKEHIGDEHLGYFVEEMARAEMLGELPATGRIRGMWNRVKAAFLAALNRTLGTSFGMENLTPEHIMAMAEAAVGRASRVTEAPGPIDTSKKLYSVSPTAEQLIRGAGPLDAEQKGAFKQFLAGVQAVPDLSYATKLRTQVADIGAAIEARFTDKWDGRVRDGLGRVNPMLLYRQAQDSAKLLLEFFQRGGLMKDPVDGRWRVTDVEGIRPPADVFPLIYRWGDTHGYSKEEATEAASRVLEAVRLDEMRTSNRINGTSFVIHEINKKSPLTADQQIDELLAVYNSEPMLKEMTELMNESRRAMVDHMVAVGRLSQDMGQMWRDSVGYVPFDRIDEYDEAVGKAFTKNKKLSGRGLAQMGKLPELVGSPTRPVGNVFNNYINTMGWMVQQTMKNDATVATLRALEDIGHAQYRNTHNPKGKASVMGYVDGAQVFWEVPSKYEVMAFKDLNAPQAGWIRNLGAFSNVLRKSVTALPPFALKQVVEDIQRAMIYSGVENPAALIGKSLRNFPSIALSEARGIRHPGTKMLSEQGMHGEYDFRSGRPAESLLKDLGIVPRGKFETLMHKLDAITQASDLAVRKAVYDQTLEETGDELLASTRARELINFRRRGYNDFVGVLVTTIPFFNAYVQGMDLLYRGLTGNNASSSIENAVARRRFWTYAGTMATISMIYALRAGDDDDYKNMDLRQRNGNWLLPTVGGVPLKIPVPGELGAAFKVPAEALVEYMSRKGTPEEQTAFQAVRTALSYMFEQYAGRVTPVPQAVKPLLEAWTNYSTLTGRQLEGFHLQQMDPSKRTTGDTSELAKAIARFSSEQVGVEVSPIMIDNSLRGYLGSSAALFTMTTDGLLNPDKTDRPLQKWMALSNYTYDPVGTRRVTEFYDLRDRVGKANVTFKELSKTDVEAAAKYAESHAEELAMNHAVNATLQQIEKTRAYGKFLNSPDGAKSMSVEERTKQLEEVKKMDLALTGWVREVETSLRGTNKR